MIYASVEEERKRPNYAVYSVLLEFIGLLGKAKDPLIAARTLDLHDVCSRLLWLLRGEQEKNLSALPEGVIIIAHDLLPSDTATIDRGHVAGIITEAGNSTSHTAIIARSYQIPAVVGVTRALENLEDGMLLALDALIGEIVAEPEEEHSELFLTQLRAALRASTFGPLQIMFPMVGSIADIRCAKAMVSAADRDPFHRSECRSGSRGG